MNSERVTHPSRTSPLPGSPWGPEAAFSITAATTHPASMIRCRTATAHCGEREREGGEKEESPMHWGHQILTHLRMQPLPRLELKSQPGLCDIELQFLSAPLTTYSRLTFGIHRMFERLPPLQLNDFCFKADHFKTRECIQIPWKTTRAAVTVSTESVSYSMFVEQLQRMLLDDITD